MGAIFHNGDYVGSVPPIDDSSVSDKKLWSSDKTNTEIENIARVVTGTVTSDYTWQGNLERSGNVCIVNFAVATGASQVPANTKLATASIKPKTGKYFFVRSNMDSSIRQAFINTNGEMSINTALTQGGNLTGEVVYFCD